MRPSSLARAPWIRTVTTVPTPGRALPSTSRPVSEMLITSTSPPGSKRARGLPSCEAGTRGDRSCMRPGPGEPGASRGSVSDMSLLDCQADLKTRLCSTSDTLQIDPEPQRIATLAVHTETATCLTDGTYRGHIPLADLLGCRWSGEHLLPRAFVDAPPYRGQRDHAVRTGLDAAVLRCVLAIHGDGRRLDVDEPSSGQQIH